VGEIEQIVPEDPKDDYLVALARTASADYLISGDPRLTSLGGEVGVQVLTPRTFYEVLAEEGR
jgi:predicted nucleic acid-binding protein